jgi:hypothetical protein
MFRTQFTSGDRPPSNAEYNAILDLLKRSRVTGLGDGLERSGSAIARRLQPRIWAQISGSGPAWSWQEAIPNASGSFDLLSGGRSGGPGSLPAYECNGAVSGVSGTVQKLTYTTAGDWRFRMVRVGSSGGGDDGGTTTVSDCICPKIPTTLSMVSSDPACNFGMFQSCSIVYGPTPEGYAPLQIGVNSFLSVESFPDVVAGGAMFRYLFTCYFNQFNLSRVYLDSPFGSPYRDGLLYSWIVGGYGNSCNPFSLFTGVGYPGSECPPNSVSISG